MAPAHSTKVHIPQGVAHPQIPKVRYRARASTHGRVGKVFEVLTDCPHPRYTGAAGAAGARVVCLAMYVHVYEARARACA